MNIADLSIIAAAATPILLAALGELIVEKSGVLNLGVEGMMLMGAVVGFILALQGYPAVWCFVGASLAAMALAALFAGLTLYLHANQVATGLAIAILGTGLSSLIGSDYVGKPFVGFAKNTWLTSDNPWVHVFFGQDVWVYLAIILVGGWWFFLKYSKWGLILIAVGENHQAAFSLGYKVRLIRLGAILLGGALAGLGGAYMSLVSPHIWTLQLSAGRGWIALALVVFATWQPLRLLFGAYLFGAISVLQYSLQGQGLQLPAQLWAAMPYLMTVLVLVVVSLKPGKLSLAAPKALGKPFIQ